MRVRTVYALTREQAIKEMPWAFKIVKVCGGYKGYESIEDYKLAKR